jgi:hypothetical protein
MLLYGLMLAFTFGASCIKQQSLCVGSRLGSRTLGNTLHGAHRKHAHPARTLLACNVDSLLLFSKSKVNLEGVPESKLSVVPCEGPSNVRAYRALCPPP